MEATELANPTTIPIFTWPLFGIGRLALHRREKSPAFIILPDAAVAVELSISGPRFYVVGFSMGGQAVWGCLIYIPHRLAGAALLAPVVNYWWRGFPAGLCNQAYYHQQFRRDQFRVSHYTPWLTSFWNTQKWFPGSSVLARSLDVLSQQDKELLLRPPPTKKMPYNMDLPAQQGEPESVHRDLKAGFGTWEFSPLQDLENPFPNNEGSVHLWHGDEDLMVPVTLERYIAQQLPWIHYHEIKGAGHFFPQAPGMSDAIFKALLTPPEKK
ncbi:uncharacterized protein LOC126789601 [Argentina anserina]|uniref:uncharacterized protein LOC126789601 n=1 Tax=Argentina anserina TaxID=57926 RepID=UPI002176735A|nr:uncharacterized protein LOC126789601 [Potentilla anserina]